MTLNHKGAIFLPAIKIINCSFFIKSSVQKLALKYNSFLNDIFDTLKDINTLGDMAESVDATDLKVLVHIF